VSPWFTIVCPTFIRFFSCFSVLRKEIWQVVAGTNTKATGSHGGSRRACRPVFECLFDLPLNETTLCSTMIVLEGP
jgi:hypothetical protein